MAGVAASQQSDAGHPVRCEDDQCFIMSDDIELLDVIHEGRSGDIYKATYNGKLVAVKQFRLPKGVSRLENKYREDLGNEYGNIKVLRGEYVVKDIGICCDTERGIYWLVMEYMPYSLRKLLADKDIVLSWDARQRIALKVCTSLEKLHGRDHPFVLTRISSNSFLLDESKQQVKVCGLGFMKTRTSAAKRKKSQSTLKYIPLEHLKDMECEYNIKSEAYGLGIVLWEIATSSEPFKDQSDSNVSKLVRNGHMEELPEDCPLEFKSVIDDLRIVDPEKRITTSDAVQRLSRIVN